MTIDVAREAAMMVPLVTGYFIGHGLDSERVFKLVSVSPEPPDAFVMHFASGLALRVKIESVEAPPATAEGGR